jgi:two-component system chemotaxis response regulator CheV
MTNVLAGVDQRTKLVGHNRLELLLFRFDGKQRFGINVFKVREVISCPPLTKLPNSHPCVVGVTQMRGNTFMVIDLPRAIGQNPVVDPSKSAVIVTEYNRNIQGFLVPHIEHIVNKNWEDVMAPPKGAGKEHFLTAVTHVEKELIQIIDVEKVLFEITGGLHPNNKANEPTSEEVKTLAAKYHVLVAEDSSVARGQIKRTLDKIGIKATLCNDGRIALNQLHQWRDSEPEKLKNLALVISDVEMPEMDGYTLTSNIRNDPALQSLRVLLHTSLSGVFNSSLLADVKADGFLSKFDSEQLGTMVVEAITGKSEIQDDFRQRI